MHLPIPIWIPLVSHMHPRFFLHKRAGIHSLNLSLTLYACWGAGASHPSLPEPDCCLLRGRSLTSLLNPLPARGPKPYTHYCCQIRCCLPGGQSPVPVIATKSVIACQGAETLPLLLWPLLRSCSLPQPCCQATQCRTFMGLEEPTLSNWCKWCLFPHCPMLPHATPCHPALPYAAQHHPIQACEQARMPMLPLKRRPLVA